MKKTLAVFLLALPLFAAQDYYIDPAGSDANVCSSGFPCASLAHTVALVPRMLDQSYTIHAADGTYAEAINTSGINGTGLQAGFILTIVGNTAFPSNVTFTGTVTCGAWTSGVCINGSAHVKLSGIRSSSTARNGLSCFSGIADLSDTTITGTLNVAAEMEDCRYRIGAAVTFSGYTPVASPGDGMGLYAARGSIGEQGSGTLTITGPGGANSLGLGMVLEMGSTFQSSGTAINITGVQYGILINNGGAFADYGGASISITNTVTVANSKGISTSSGASFDTNGMSLTIGHFTKCISAYGLSVMAHGGGSRSLTNCTATDAAQGSQIILF